MTDGSETGPSATDVEGDDGSPNEGAESTSVADRDQSLAVEPTTESRPTTTVTTDRRSLASRVQLQWSLRIVIGAVVLSAIATFVLSWLDVDPRVGGGIFTLALVLGALWVGLYYRLWVYQIRDDAIYLERGVVTHVRTLVPYVRIQHVDTSRGPLERALGLSTLVVYTAGSRGADVSIPGLTPEEASDLQDRIKDLTIETEGGDAL